jgi:hypothetical protein
LKVSGSCSCGTPSIFADTSSETFADLIGVLKALFSNAFASPESPSSPPPQADSASAAADARATRSRLISLRSRNRTSESPES